MIRNTLLRLRCNVSLFAAAAVAFVIANSAVAAVLSASSGPIVNAECTTTLSTTPAALNFAATKSGPGGDLITTTDPQAITVHFSGTVPTWTASADQSWVQITGGANTGAQQFTVSIANPGNIIGGATSVTSTITITAATAPPVTVAVNLAVQQTTTSSAPPFGQVDTPAQGATGVQGAISLTGWALDQVGVTAVDVYRTCFPFDEQDSCGLIGSDNVAFVGTANFVAGARPDVEAAYPNYPFASRAGWGLLILTNSLPDVGASKVTGGQGTMQFFAYALDDEGHRTLLGRSTTDHTATSVTLDNNHIAKPFGALDTPAQSATVAGTVTVFGWALTPDSNTVKDSSDIIVPVDGSTVSILVDGTAVGTMVYDGCRGNVGNPPPAGIYCNDDVSNSFGGTMPKQALLPRTSNPTIFRNLDSGLGPIGHFMLDTTTLVNGQHTVTMVVTDSAGRTAGTDSRFFTVLNPNGGSGTSSLQDLSLAPAASRGSASSLDNLSTSGRPLSMRSGFAPAAATTEAPRTASGVRTVQVEPAGRLELSLSAPVTTGYMVVNGQLRDLPVGSSLNTATGVFTWTPPPSYLGLYHLVFIAGSEKVLVDVNVVP